MRARFLLSALALLLAVAPSAAAQAAVRLPGADRALAAPGQPLFSVGRVDGPGPEAFSRVAHVGFDRSDNLYVLDQGAGRVVVFDPRGRLLRQFGRRGRGPGEFIVPMQLVIAADGSVVVSDPGRGGFMVFSPEGVYRTTVPFAARGNVTGVEVRAYPAEGVVTVVQQMAGMGGPGAPQAGSRSLVWQRLDGSATSNILFRDGGVAAPGQGEAQSGSRVSVSRTVVFAPQLHFAVFPSGALAVAHTERYRINVTGRGPRQPTARIVERPLQPRRVTDADRERARENARGGMTLISGGHGDAHGPPPAAVAQHAANLQFADVMPVIQGLAVDRAGRLWVQRSARQAGRDDGPIDLLTEQGDYLGTITGVGMPAAFGAGRAAWIEADVLGVQRVVVRALPAWR
jgi:hypothetical protein